MRTLSRAKLAEVLESVAEYIDETEQQKTAAENTVRNERIEKLAERYSSSTGEDIPAEIRAKLAALDTSTLDHLLKVAKNNNESPEALGQPADNEDTPAPRTVKEAAEHAENRFLNWINS